jgi:putative PIN family toxin of toxin-antitoxin system
LDKLFNVRQVNFIRCIINPRENQIYFSKELLNEFVSVTLRTKFNKYFSKADVDQLLSVFELYGEVMPVSSKNHLCRDPKDNFLLDLAIDGEADYLVTGDLDLLELKKNW